MTRFLWIALAVLAGGAMAGCQVDKQYAWDYGRAYHTVFENQKLDPSAGDDTPVAGMDGAVAAAAYKRYEEAKPESRDKPAPTILQFSSKSQ